MSKPHAVAALAASLLLAAPVAFAQSRTGASPAQHEQTDEHESRLEVQAFGRAKASLADAVSAAEKHSRGQALDVSFEENHGQPSYQVKTYQAGQIWEGRVDASSGQVVGQGKTMDEAKLDNEDMAEISALKRAKTTLSDAVKAAERKTGGKAIDAGLEAAGGKVAYEIETVRNGALRRVRVDPQSGKVAVNTSGRATAGSSAPSSP